MEFAGSNRVSAATSPFSATLLAALAGVALLSACNTSSRTRFEPEEFGSTTTHSRSYGAAPAHSCEAARRALLSQGFMITQADAERVNGRKNFQPDAEVHVEIEFHVVCASEGRGANKTIVFVNALQDRYALKKSNNSASVGVGVLGSLSLPFSSSDDSMVRVGSETITAGNFYDRFFVLLKRYLQADTENVEPKDDPTPVLLPVPVAPGAGPASVR